MDAAVELLVLKLVIAPVFVGVISLIALRYGHRTAGWLVALPINTGTIVFVLTLTEGPAFAATAALGALLGIVSLSAFAVGYARSAVRLPWTACLAIASAAFVLSTLLLSQLPEFVLGDLLGAGVAIAVVLAVVPTPRAPESTSRPPRWEIPVRMLTAALLVLVITTAAGTLGARLSGLLSPIPVFTITLVIFTHSRQGPDPVFVFLRGLQYGLFSFAAFCAVVGVLLVPFGLVVAFVGGLAAFLGVYAIIRRMLEVTSVRSVGRTTEPPNP